MPYIADQWKEGTWPLQDPNYRKQQLQLHERAFRQAVRITGREKSAGRIGHYEYDDESAGDVLLGFLWKVAGAVPLTDSRILAAPRSIPAWMFASPTIIQRAKDSSVVISDPNQRGLVRAGTKPLAFPIFSGRFDPDVRFKPQIPLSPDFQCWPDHPGGTIGIILDSTDEENQEALFFPTDRRLICVNFAGRPSMASLVADLDDEDNIDPERCARLQSAWRVIKPWAGCFPSKDQTLNHLAWQLGRSGRDNLEGLGLAYDTQGFDVGDSKLPARTIQEPEEDGPLAGRRTVALPRQQPLPPGTSKGVVGAFGVQASGPFVCGGTNDQHEIGVTKDGEKVNSGHLSTKSYFIGHGGDAPINWSDELYVDPGPNPLRTRVTPFMLDPNAKHDHVCGTKDGLWKLLAEVPLPSPGFVKVPPEESYRIPATVRTASQPKSTVWGVGERVDLHDQVTTSGLIHKFKVPQKPFQECNTLRLIVMFSLTDQSLGADPFGNKLTMFCDMQKTSIGDREPTTFSTTEATIDGATTTVSPDKKYTIAWNMTKATGIELKYCDEVWIAFGRKITLDGEFDFNMLTHNLYLQWDKTARPETTISGPKDRVTFPMIATRAGVVLTD